MSVPRLVFAVFIVLQAADGLMTYGTVRALGPSAEANQLIVTWMTLTGLGVAILGAKALAAICYELETLGGTGAVDGAGNRLPEVERQFELVCTALEAEARVCGKNASAGTLKQ